MRTSQESPKSRQAPPRTPLDKPSKLGSSGRESRASLMAATGSDDLNEEMPNGSRSNEARDDPTVSVRQSTNHECQERRVRYERFSLTDQWKAGRGRWEPRCDQSRDRAGSDNRAPRRSGPA